MSSPQDLGVWGEQLAEDYLRQAGHRLLARNWKCKAGEIDLIMQQRDELVFVEVRLRQKTMYGAGLETVAWQKQRKLIKAAQWYLQETGQYHLSPRFDVISIQHEGGQNPQIEHIAYAFEVG